MTSKFIKNLKQQSYIKFDVSDRLTSIKIEYKKQAYIKFDVSDRPTYIKFV